MNKKTMYLIVAVLVIVIIIAGAAAYLLSNNGGGGGTTPTPTPSATPVPTVVGASTLQLNVNETGSAGTVTYMFSAKNLNTTTLVVRMDILGGMPATTATSLTQAPKKPTATSTMPQHGHQMIAPLTTQW